jgi:hypothetical protein
MGNIPLVEQDVRSGDVSVNNAASMDVSKRPAQLPGCAVEAGERNLTTSGLKISTVVTESVAGQVFVHEVRTRRIKVEVVERDDRVV